jgi:subtilisin
MKNYKKSLFGIMCLSFLFIIGFSSSGLAAFDPGGSGGSLPPDPPILSQPPSPDYDGIIELSWSKSSGPYPYDIGYKVYRSDSEYGTYTKIATTDWWTRSYTDIGRVTGTWWYYVRAYDNYRTSDPSNRVSVEVILPPQTLPWGVDRVDAEKVWGSYEDAEHVVEGNNAGQGINVLVIDTGINYLHPDLMDNYVWGYDWVDDDFDPMDEDGHGTICAGVIAAVDNTFGIIGTAPKINLYAARIAWVDDYGIDHINAYDLVDALIWAAFPYDRADNMRPEGNPKMDIISMSLGWDYDVYLPDLSYWCEAVRDAGVVLVAASGNYHEVLHPSYDVLWPANYYSVISVGASDQNNQWADFSCYIGDLDVVAPGVDIVSTGLTGYPDDLDGTSLACPHVAGICALILYSYNKNLTPSELEYILFNTAIDLGDVRTGNGLVNADYAVA